MSSILRDTPQNYRATTRGVVPAEITAHYEQYGLRDKDFADVSQHPEVRAERERLEAARIDLNEQPMPLPDGWLDGINMVEQSLAGPQGAREWVEAAGVHEPSAAERAAGEQVAAIGLLTGALAGVRGSDYAKAELAGKTRADLDLSVRGAI